MDEDFHTELSATRHPGGRVIDFGVTRSGLYATKREQAAGVSDHDIVVYQFPCGLDNPERLVVPTRAQLEVEEDVDHTQSRLKFATAKLKKLSEKSKMFWSEATHHSNPLQSCRSPITLV